MRPIDEKRIRLSGVSTPVMRGDNLAIVLASFFEPQIESEEMDESETWKQGAIDAANEVLDAIHMHYTRCEDCPPEGYPTDKTRCSACDRRVK